MAPFFQAGLLVADAERASAELSAALGLQWSELTTRDVGPYPQRIVFSLQGPPYLELIEGAPGSPWDVTAGPQLDHLGFWSEDLAADRRRLEQLGFRVEVDGMNPPYPGFFLYLRAPVTNLRVELITAAARDQFFERWGLEDPGDDTYRDAAPWHAGIQVAELDAAKRELSDALGVAWGREVNGQVGDLPVRAAFSTETPGLELVEAPAGIPWMSGRVGIDHLCWSSPDLDGTAAAVEKAGATELVDGREYGFPMRMLVAPDTGLHIEVCDEAGRRSVES